MQNLSYENEFDLHENEPVGGTHFPMNGFAQRLVLTQGQKATRKWPIDLKNSSHCLGIVQFWQSSESHFELSL